MLDPHDHDIVAIAGKWILEHIILIVGAVGGVFSSIGWIAHQRFATRSDLAKTNQALTDCKEATVDEFKQSLKEHEDRELEAEKHAHAEIKEDIGHLYNKVAGVDKKVDELTKTILDNIWRDNRK